MDAEVIKGMTYSGAGMLIVGLSVWLIRALISRSVTRADNEGSLDQRATGMVQAIGTAYEKIIDDQRDTIKGQGAKIDSLHEQLFTAYQRFGDIVGQQQQTISAEVAKVRDVHNDAMKRINDKLDQCTNDHRQCQAETLEIKGEVTALRSMVGNMSPTMNVNVDQHRSGRRPNDPPLAPA